jgi:hypothetical protein
VEFGLGGRGDELDAATWVSGGALFVGPVEGSVGSFGRCGVSSSLRIILLGQLQGRRGRDLEEIVSYSGMVLNLVLVGNYVLRSRG